MEKTAFIFSGQGSQYAGMGIKLQDYQTGRETLEEANDILDIDIAKICCNGDGEALNSTKINQPAILTCSIAAFRILKESDRLPLAKNPSAVAGLSVGEYSALVASNVISFADAIKLVKERGRLMTEASKARPGIMVALLGLNNDIVESICNEASDFGLVSPANYNCPGQIVISGEKKAVEKAIELAQKAGVKKCIALKVEGAFHSALMLPAESGLREIINQISFSKPQTPFVSNATGDYIEGVEDIKNSLALQLSHSIQWEASIHRIVKDGITNFLEIGPGKVLTGLVRRIHREAKIFNSDELLGQ